MKHDAVIFLPLFLNAKVACQAHLLAVPHRRPLHDANHITSVHGKPLGGLSQRMSAATSPAGDTTSSYGNTTMPAFFHPSSNLAPAGAVRRAASGVLLGLLGLLLALDTSSIFWVLFAVAVAVVMAAGGGGSGAGGGEGAGPVAHFGFPAEFHLVNEESGEMAGIEERPQVLWRGALFVTRLFPYLPYRAGHNTTFDADDLF